MALEAETWRNTQSDISMQSTEKHSQKAYTQVAASLGEYARSRYNFKPPDRGMPVPSSSSPKAPHVAISPARTQMNMDMPVDPDSL